MKDEPDYKRMFLAIFLAGMVLIGWQALVEWPRRQHLAQYTQMKEYKQKEKQEQYAKNLPSGTEAEDNSMLTREERLRASARIIIRSETLHGSIALKGARFDDLKLAKYREGLDPLSPEVTLFSPSGDAQSYLAQIGWLAQDGTLVPDQHTPWQADKHELIAGDTVTLRWNNGQGVAFILAIALDQDYMFSVTQRVENHSGHAIAVIPYAYINRTHEEPPQSNAIIHEGPLGVLQGKLEETSYKDLRDKGNKTYEDVSGWFGMSDKYWLAALIPGSDHFKATYSHYAKDNRERYQVDFMNGTLDIADGASAECQVRLFAGAKELTVLDRYASGAGGKPPITLFDRAIDFGALYFLAKPMFLLLTFFFAHIGNFGVAILMLTVVVRLLLYPLANKSYKATAQMRKLQPEMNKIRERYFDDQITLQKETMALYKRAKVNPAAGCLPVLLQMPVFFALYKVLYVSIEMRHAPFLGWVRDLSAADPSNLFTAFGLIPWTTPSWLHLGILPMLMCATMVLQMRQQPKPADPTQAKMMMYMPYFLLIIFAKMPAGLVLYWTWGNIISIAQQYVISTRHEKHEKRKVRHATGHGS